MNLIDGCILFQFYNMIKQQAIENLGLKQLKRDFFDPQACIELPEWQISIWPGYKTTIRDHERGLCLSCEVTHKILRTDSALNTIRQIERNCKQIGRAHV